MGTLKGRRFYFATANDLRPGLALAEASARPQYVLNEMREDRLVTIFDSLAASPDFGSCPSGSKGSLQYFVYPRGRLGRSLVPAASAVPQRRGPTKYVSHPSADCLILNTGGLHPATGALVAGELQQPLDPGRRALELFELFCETVLGGFTKIGLYWLGAEALAGFRSGQRLATIGVRSPAEYDLQEQPRSALERRGNG